MWDKSHAEALAHDIKKSCEVTQQGRSTAAKETHGRPQLLPYHTV